MFVVEEVHHVLLWVIVFFNIFILVFLSLKSQLLIDVILQIFITVFVVLIFHVSLSTPLVGTDSTCRAQWSLPILSLFWDLWLRLIALIVSLELLIQLFYLVVEITSVLLRILDLQVVACRLLSLSNLCARISQIFLTARSLFLLPHELLNSPLVCPTIRRLARDRVPASNSTRCYELLLVSNASIVHVLLLQIL